MQKRVFVAPTKYVQGEGVLETLGQEVETFGKQFLVLADETVWGITSEQVENSFNNSEAEFTYEEFTGESSDSEINRIADLLKEKDLDGIIGLGGGKTLDTAKGVADIIEKPTIIVPTTASTDAPTSSLSVVYSDDGVFEGYKFYDTNPNLVLLDTKVIIGAPIQLFAAGMGDAMATAVEARASIKRNSTTMAGGLATLAAQAISEKAEAVIFDQGPVAYRAAKEGLVTPQVENIIEANTLLSGLGFENGGLSGAHAIHNGFTALDGEIHDKSHGEKVAYGILTQLVLEGFNDKEINKYADFFKAIELPTTLADLGIENSSYEELVSVGEIAVSEEETLRNMNPDITADQVADAILAVDAITQA